MKTHNLGFKQRRIMFIQSVAPRQTRSSTSPDPLAAHGLTWSDIQKSKYESRQEMLDAVVVSICLIALLFFWLVVPELFRA